MRPLALLLLLSGLATPRLSGQTLTELTRSFYRASDARDSAAMRALMAADVRFHDPTFGLRRDGADSTLKLYTDNFRLVDEHRWEILEVFETDSFTVVRGVYHSGFPGERVGVPSVRAGAAVPFHTVFTWRDGRIVRQLDFFAYDAWDAANPRIPIPVRRRHEPAGKLAEIADRWVRTGADLPASLDGFVGLYADSMVFVDPTFRLGLRGRDRFRSEVLRYSTQGAPYRPSSEIIARFLSGAFIAIWGRYSQDHPNRRAERVGMRFLTVLEVADGRIIRHHDFYEAEPFNHAVQD